MKTQKSILTFTDTRGPPQPRPEISRGYDEPDGGLENLNPVPCSVPTRCDSAHTQYTLLKCHSCEILTEQVQKLSLEVDILKRDISDMKSAVFETNDGVKRLLNPPPACRSSAYSDSGWSDMGKTLSSVSSESDAGLVYHF